MKIRKESTSDFAAIEHVIVEAFKNVEHTDGNEHNLVKRLRQAKDFMPDLSLVAEVEGSIVGHILFTRILIRSADGKENESLALAPVSVRPDFQNKGVGAALIQEGHRVAKEKGFSSVILLGHPGYYPKFGYRKASLWGIKAPFDVPDEAFMALELKKGALNNLEGIVEYPAAFQI